MSSSTRCRPSDRSCARRRGDGGDDDATPRGHEGSRGIALLVVIWIMAVVLALLGALTQESGLARRLAHNLGEGAKARAAADAGIFLTLRAILNAPPAKPFPADGTPQSFTYDGVEISVALQDEGGKIDINTGQEAMLSALLAEFGVGGTANATLVDAIVDWRGNGTLHRLHAPSPADYRAAGLDAPRNAPFAAVEDLRAVLGVTPDLYRKLAPYITVYSHNQRVNALNAPEAVLRALPGLTRRQVDSFLELRGHPATPSAAATTLMRAAQPYITWAAPQVVSVRSEAHLASGSRFVREAVIELTRAVETPYRILAWRQYVPDEEPEPQE